MAERLRDKDTALNVINTTFNHLIGRGHQFQHNALQRICDSFMEVGVNTPDPFSWLDSAFRAEETNPELTLRFEPEEDITAYELAMIVSNKSGFGTFKTGMAMRKNAFDALSPEVRRHLKGTS